MVTLNAKDFRERSPLYTLQTTARMARLGDSLIVSRYAEQDESAQLGRCALLDLSNLARVGFRGVDAAAHLHAEQFDLPTAPNRCVMQGDGSNVARLSQTEYFLLGSFQDAGARLQKLEDQWQLSEKGCYLLPRQDSHAWLVLTGEHISSVMAKVCGVDLRQQAFAPGDVAQTSVARMSAIIINGSQPDLPLFHILCDRASAQYLWGALLDAMQEFGGKPVGVDALLA
jgi:sarcosine oxidase subunit gamma